MYKTTCSFLALVTLASSVSAQTLAQQDFDRSWLRNQISIKINLDMPPVCDDFITAAAATWNNQGANILIYTGTTNDFYYEDRIYGTGGSQIRTRESNVINVEPVAFYSSDAAIMKGPSYTHPTTNAFKEIYDADVQVREEYLYYSESATTGNGLICTSATTIPSTKFDFQSVMLHELGHNLGFNHRTRPTYCVMYEYGSRGRVARTPCSDERLALQTIYGRR